MLRFARKPEEPIDTLSDEPTETIWLWLYLSLFLLSEGACDEAMGRHPLFHSQGPHHAEMVEYARTAGGWTATPFF